MVVQIFDRFQKSCSQISDMPKLKEFLESRLLGIKGALIYNNTRITYTCFFFFFKKAYLRIVLDTWYDFKTKRRKKNYSKMLPFLSKRKDLIYPCSEYYQTIQILFMNEKGQKFYFYFILIFCFRQKRKGESCLDKFDS